MPRRLQRRKVTPIKRAVGRVVFRVLGTVAGRQIKRILPTREEAEMVAAELPPDSVVRTLCASRIAAVGAFFTRFQPHGIAQRIVEPLPYALLLPVRKTVPDQFPGRQVVGPHPPRAPAAHQIENRVQDCALGLFLRSPGLARPRNQRVENRPFRFIQITRITWLADRLLPSRFRSDQTGLGDRIRTF